MNRGWSFEVKGVFVRDDKLNDMLQSRNDTYREAETIYHWQETISR